MAIEGNASGQRVAIVGAGLAGLCAAAAASQAGHDVVLLDRDRLEGAEPRSGVPQGRQPHVYLLRGLQASEQLLPGLRNDLLTAGAVPMDTARLAWLAPPGWYPLRAAEYQILSLTRPLFEAVVRTRVLTLDRVELRDGHRVNGLSPPGSDGGDRWRVRTVDDGHIGADIVVDASGRGSRLRSWLGAVGVSPPSESRVDARVGYATREYRNCPDLGSLSGIIIQITPQRPIGAAVLPMQNGRWLVTVIGMGQRRPPRDVAGFEAMLDELADPSVADFVAASEPCGNVVIHRETENRRYHFERLRDWPDDLLVIGDAFISFNPIFGQGTTVAACQAVAFGQALGRGWRSSETRPLMRRFAKLATLPWNVAVSQDLRQPTSKGRQSRLQEVSDAWARELSSLAAHGDLRAFTVLTRLYHLLGTPGSMLHPALLGSALRARVFGYPPAVARPSDLLSLAARSSSE